jgi:hypothetical protein
MIQGALVAYVVAAANAPSSRVQLWVDRQLVIDHQKAMITGAARVATDWAPSWHRREQGRHAGD